eukprot:TRINITY_DN51767_c0_g1_i1.p1 TRINITY_DN51767_c0_g1~~TRINITY_DN51767_c0_g1_i1.p1  ORF type:complete len:194 (-),score=23.53 TRINITY_DN51767_c0_g1_i1:80-616(-)
MDEDPYGLSELLDDITNARTGPPPARPFFLEPLKVKPQLPSTRSAVAEALKHLKSAKDTHTGLLEDLRAQTRMKVGKLRRPKAVAPLKPSPRNIDIGFKEEFASISPMREPLASDWDTPRRCTRVCNYPLIGMSGSFYNKVLIDKPRWKETSPNCHLRRDGTGIDSVPPSRPGTTAEG